MSIFTDSQIMLNRPFYNNPIQLSKKNVTLFAKLFFFYNRKSETKRQRTLTGTTFSKRYTLYTKFTPV